MTLLQAPRRTTADVTWHLADTDFHVAHAAGRFAGTIDVHGTHHYVRDCFGAYIGDFHTLTAAQAHLVAHLAG